jgi:hypothetical protein
MRFFRPSQWVRLLVLGTLLWFVAVLLLRAIGPLSWSGRVLLYVLVVPGTVPFLWLVRWLAQLQRDRVHVGVAVVTATALLCDGVAFGWFPQLYSGDAHVAVASAGAVFWGAGVGLVLGLATARRQSSENAETS